MVQINGTTDNYNKTKQLTVHYYRIDQVCVYWSCSDRADRVLTFHSYLYLVLTITTVNKVWWAEGGRGRGGGGTYDNSTLSILFSSTQSSIM